MAAIEWVWFLLSVRMYEQYCRVSLCVDVVSTSSIFKIILVGLFLVKYLSRKRGKKDLKSKKHQNHYTYTRIMTDY